MKNNICTISFTINGQHCERTIPASLLLIDLIRDELKLKGTKSGCLEGECGSCCVLVDGIAVNSCLYLALNVDGQSLTTIEGLSGGEKSLDAVQQSMVDSGAVQCGYCTSGMVMAIKSFQDQCHKNNHKPEREEIKKGLECYICICRC